IRARRAQKQLKIHIKWLAAVGRSACEKKTAWGYTEHVSECDCMHNAQEECHMSDRSIYLDHAATTPVDEQVVAAMLPYFTAKPGNPSSIHRAGRAALEALDDAR